jgi:hypothetical protein
MLSFGTTGHGMLTAKYDDNTPITSGSMIGFTRNVILTATPESGHQIKSWTDNGETVNGANMVYTIPNFITRHTVMVEFEPETYPVTFEVVNGNGKLTAKADGETITSTLQVEHGKTIELEAEPDDGYRVKEWIYNGRILSENKSNILELLNLNETVTVTVEFERASYPVSFNVVNGNGTLSASVDNMISIETGQLVPHDRDIVFTATPDNDYRVKEWTLNDLPVPNNRTNSFSLNLTEPVFVTVEFELIPITITTSVLEDCVTGTMYSQMLFAISETALKWSIEKGSLPAGLELSSDGEILGIALKSGTFIFIVKAENSIDNDTKELTLAVIKGVGEAVPAPVAHSTTLNSITLNAVTTLYEHPVEYAISIKNNADAESLTWQDVLTFNGLVANATYYAYARSKANSDFLAGPVSAPSAPIVTDGNKPTGSGEDMLVTPLTAHIKGGRLFVRGLSEGKLWSVYSVSGALMYRSIATGNEMDIALTSQGVLIIQSEKKTVKVANYGQ